jgi:hypothetical protein
LEERSGKSKNAIKNKQYIENTQRPVAIGSGEYRLRVNPKSKPRRIGIHLPSFYSSWLTWGEMAEIFIKAQGDPLKMRNVVNNWWAQPWKEVAIAKTVEEILTNKVDILRLVFPKGSVALTCGIDPGQGGFKSTAER